MKTLIEVNPLLHHERTGIPNYIYQLCRGLLSRPDGSEYVLWGPDVDRDPFPEFPHKRFRGRGLFPRSVLEGLWEYSNWEAVPGDVDLYHLPFPVVPAPRRSKRTRVVVTICDIAFARYPETVMDPSYLRHLLKAFPRQVEEADHLLTISEATKRDLVEILDADPNRITVTYLGSDIQAPASEQVDHLWPEMAARLELPENYILTLGTMEPRKNLGAVLRAYHALEEKLRKADIYLCMAGGARWSYQEAERLAGELGIADRVRSLGYVPREWLPALFARSRMFVYPSFYEGFGLPVLEGMACGAAVVTSSTSSLPEVAGDAALLVNPASVPELAHAMERYLDDEDLRQTMIRRGRERAKLFSWERTVEETRAVYQALGR